MKSIVVSYFEGQCLCTGLKKIVRLSADEDSGYYMVYVDAGVENIYEPLELWQNYRNYQLFGTIPQEDELNRSGFLGFVNLYKKSNTEDFEGHQFHVLDAYRFDKFYAVKREDMDYFASIDIHKILPFHEVGSPMVYDLLDSLSLQVSKSVFDLASCNAEITLEVCDKIKDELLDENGDLRHFDALCLNCGQLKKSFVFDGQLEAELDEDDEPILYPSFSNEHGKDIRMYLTLRCYKPIIE